MTFEKVQKILAEQLELDADEITMDSSLVEDLGIDSPVPYTHLTLPTT